MKKFSKWYKFSELFDYKGLVSDKFNRRSQYFIKLGVKYNQFNQNNGFVLNKKNKIKIKPTSKGLYFLKIFTQKLGTKIYIGKSEGKTLESDSGIVKRLEDHFQKLQTVPQRSDNKNKKSLFKELAFKKEFGGKGYLLEWNEDKTDLLKKKVKLIDADRVPGDIRDGKVMVLGEFEDIGSVSESFLKISGEETNVNWKKFYKEAKIKHGTELYDPAFWNDNCEISILLVDDLLNNLSKEEQRKLIKEDIDGAETKAIHALRRNFDENDILNKQKMTRPPKICQIERKLFHNNIFDLNSVDARSGDLILNNAKKILKKLDKQLKNEFIKKLERISKKKDYYLNLTLTGNNDLRLCPIRQRKKAKNFMIFKPTRNFISCNCILSLNELNNFFEKNNLNNSIYDIKKIESNKKNINSSFKIVKLNKSDWLNELMDACYDRYNIKYPYKKSEETITPKYGSGPNGRRSN